MHTPAAQTAAFVSSSTRPVVRPSPRRPNTRQPSARQVVRLAAALATGLGLAGGILAMGMVSMGMAPRMAPEPDPVPRRWELKLELGGLRLASFPVQGQPKSFYYLTYKVINRSGKELLFAPSFEMAFGDGKPIRAGRDVPAEVTKAILEKMQNQFLQDQIAVIGPILEGEENAKEGLVIWSGENLAPARLTVYAAGFSGETATVDVPGTKDKVVLRKSLMVRYNSGGEVTGRGDGSLDVAERRWIMR